MKRIAIFALAAAALFGSCESKKEKEAQALKDAQTQATLDSLRNALNSSETETDELLSTVEMIQEGFKQITAAEGIVAVQSAKGEGANKEVIMQNMALIQNKLKLNRELLANLQNQLRSSGQSNSALKKQIEDMAADFQAQLNTKSKEMEDLRQQLAEKDLRISEQDAQITSLNQNVSNLSNTNEQQAKTIQKNTEDIARQDAQIHTAYYVFGTKKELREQRILQSGDVLKSNDFNRDYFTKIDIRATKTIKLYSKSASLETNHPAGSYSLSKDAQGQYVLRITNPDLFWSVSKYLVIIVK